MSQRNNTYVARSARTIAILTLMTSVFWTALSIYSALNKLIDTQVQPETLKSVDPSLDIETLTLLTQKRQLTNDEQAGELLKQALELTATPTEKASVNEVSSKEASASGKSAL